MRILITAAGLLAVSASAFAQVAAIPAFTVTSNDVVQSSIRIFHMKGFDMGGTNDAKVTVKYDFTDTGAKRLEEFYRAHPVGQEVRFQIGKFEHVLKLDNRKHFEREGWWGLPEREAKALEAGLKGRT